MFIFIYTVYICLMQQERVRNSERESKREWASKTKGESVRNNQCSVTQHRQKNFQNKQPTLALLLHVCKQSDATLRCYVMANILNFIANECEKPTFSNFYQEGLGNILLFWIPSSPEQDVFLVPQNALSALPGISMATTALTSWKTNISSSQ